MGGQSVPLEVEPQSGQRLSQRTASSNELQNYEALILKHLVACPRSVKRTLASTIDTVTKSDTIHERHYKRILLIFAHTSHRP